MAGTVAKWSRILLLLVLALEATGRAATAALHGQPEDEEAAKLDAFLSTTSNSTDDYQSNHDHKKNI